MLVTAFRAETNKQKKEHKEKIFVLPLFFSFAIAVTGFNNNNKKKSVLLPVFACTYLFFFFLFLFYWSVLRLGVAWERKIVSALFFFCFLSSFSCLSLFPSNSFVLPLFFSPFSLAFHIVLCFLYFILDFLLLLVADCSHTTPKESANEHKKKRRKETSPRLRALPLFKPVLPSYSFLFSICRSLHFFFVLCSLRRLPTWPLHHIAPARRYHSCPQTFSLICLPILYVTSFCLFKCVFPYFPYFRFLCFCSSFCFFFLPFFWAFFFCFSPFLSDLALPISAANAPLDRHQHSVFEKALVFCLVRQSERTRRERSRTLPRSVKRFYFDVNIRLLSTFCLSYFSLFYYFTVPERSYLCVFVCETCEVSAFFFTPSSSSPFTPSPFFVRLFVPSFFFVVLALDALTAPPWCQLSWCLLPWCCLFLPRGLRHRCT